MTEYIVKISAKEAKASSDMINSIKKTSEIAIVFKNIKDKSDKGEYNYSGSGSLMAETINKLIELGYHYERGGRMNEVDYNITWK